MHLQADNDSADKLYLLTSATKTTGTTAASRQVQGSSYDWTPAL
jgi:hypothetical protein